MHAEEGGSVTSNISDLAQKQIVHDRRIIKSAYLSDIYFYCSLTAAALPASLASELFSCSLLAAAAESASRDFGYLRAEGGVCRDVFGEQGSIR